MKRLVWIPLLIASASSAQQIAPPPATAAPGASSARAVGVQGVTGGLPIPISGSISTSGAADAVSAGAPTTFNANTICTGQLLLAGEQGAGFQLNAGTLAGTLVPQYSLEASGANWTTTQFIDQNGTKSASLIVTNPNALFQQGIVLVTGARRAQVCTTAFTSGSATGLATAAFVQGGASAGGGGGTDVAIHDNSTPSQHLGVNASGQAAIQNPPNLDAALSTRASEATLAKLPVAQGSTTSSQSGPLAQGAVTTSAPSYTTAQTSPISLTTAGALRTDASATTQPISGSVSVSNFPGTQAVSGTVTSNQGAAPWTQRIQDGAGSTLATVTAGNAVKVDGSAVTQPVSGTVTSNIGTTNGLALDASVTGLQVSQGSTTSGQKGDLALGAVTTSAPSYTTAQTSPLSLNTAGGLRVDGSGVTQPISAASLPLPAGASTSAKQPALGTAGSASADVITVQGIASMTALKVDGSAVTQPVSGTVTTTPPTNASENVAQFGGTNVSTGTGAGGTGIPRVTISNDSSLAANQSVNVAQVNGVGTTTGAGTSTTGTQRVAVATSDGSQLATANTGRLQVDVVTGGGSNASVGTTYTTTPTSAALAGLAGQNGTMVPARATPDGSLQVSVSPNSPINVTQIITGTSTGKQTITVPSLKFQLQDEQGHVAPVKGPGKPATVADQAMVVAPSPVPAPICSSVAAISQTANTRLIVGVAGRRIFICSMLLVSATAQSVALTEGTGATCGTLALALIGSTTVANGPSLAANGGWAQTSSSPYLNTQVLGDDLCLLQSGSGNVSGSITFTQF